jgi:hypothetical protein
MMTSWQIRSWLLQLPKPARVRLTDVNGDTKELECQKRPMMRVAESIAAIKPELVECLSEDSTLLRAMRPGSEGEPGTSAPAIPAGLQTDPHALLMSHFASLLHRAYEHSTELAFVKLLEIVERMGERSDAIEKRLERTEANYRREQSDRIDDLWDRAEEMAAQAGTGANGRDAILQQFMQGFFGGKRAAQAGEPPPTPPTPPNGGKPA